MITIRTSHETRHRTADENLEGCSVMGRPTNKKRKTVQEQVERYMKDREDLQVSGRIPVTSEGAIRDERVDPSVQEEQRTDSLDRAAITKGWAVPEHIKLKVIERLAEPFFETPLIMKDQEGNDVVVPPDRYLMGMNARVLVAADKEQWERDNPEAAGKAKGSINVTQQMAVGVDWAEITGDVIDPAQQAIDGLKAIKEQNNERQVPDIRGSVPGGDEVKIPLQEVAGGQVGQD